MTENDLRLAYQQMAPHLQDLGSRLLAELERDLEAADIKIISISFRVKTFDSFKEKIERKQVANPFNQIHDLLGFRIICFTLEDVQNTEELILKKFKIFQAVSKTDILEYDKFGYRSNHYNFVLTGEILDENHPNEMAGLFAEIQVRTVLMHTWSTIHRQLEYKKKEHIPFSLRRKLSQLAALLEIADDHLQELSDERSELKELLKDKTLQEARNIGVDTSLNLDSLIAFIEHQFPERHISQTGVHRLLDELLGLNLSLETLINAFDKIKPIRAEIDTHLKAAQFSTVKGFKFALMCGNDNYWDYKKKQSKKPGFEHIQDLRLKLLSLD